MYVPYRVEDVIDITEKCYGRHSIGKIIFKNFEIKDYEHPKNFDCKKFKII